MGDHAESLQIDYDPIVLSYEQIIDLFWRSHRATRPRSRQYMSAIFYHNPKQEKIAKRTMAEQQSVQNGKILTLVQPSETFYLAEEYHQKHKLSWEKKYLAELQAIYPNFKDFNNSTAVARINGFIHYSGDKTLLKREIEQYGLSLALQQKLLV